MSGYDGEAFVTFTTQDGLANNVVTFILEDRKGHLWFATRLGGVSRYDGEEFVTFTTQEGLASNEVTSILEDQAGNLWFGTRGGGVSRYDGEAFATFTTQEGLASNGVSSILEDQEGHLWFATGIAGVSRYDGEEFVTFTTQEGLANNQVVSILEDQEGDLWFGTFGGGVSRYEGSHLVLFTTEDGLANNGVMCVLQDRAGHLWFGTWGGVSHYDGEEFDTTFTTDDGLALNNVWAILEDRKGHLWFGTYGGGVSRYDGEEFVTFTTQDGLADNSVRAILEDRAGLLWFGTYGGVSRYDGEQFVVTFTTKDGLGVNDVWAILEDREGDLWFGTAGGGVSRYDGEAFVTFTTADGLAGNSVRAILEDREGHLWFGTWGGVSRYDGEQFVTFGLQDGLAVLSILEDWEGHLWFGTWGGGIDRYDRFMWQALSRRDGLADDAVQQILQDRDGDIWIATEGGITRYRPRHTPPSISLTDVIADHGYGPVGEIRLSTSQQYITFEFQGRSLNTRPDRMAYVVRLKGYEAKWRPTRARRVEYTDLPRGKYVFQVKAVDRDLNYSEVPAEVRVTIHLPYGRIVLIGLLGMALVAAVVASGYAVKRRRERDHVQQALLETQTQLVEEMGKELQVAHDLQMNLMPKASPQIPGFDIAGRCLPANRVGGDYFDYLWVDEEHTKLCIVLADVAGSAMKAAIPVVMFSGMLHATLEQASSPADLLNHLNRSLPPKLGKLEPHSFISCCVAFLDVQTKQMVLCNAGQPGPLVRRGEHVHTISMETSHWPLGILSEVHYEDVVSDLQEGDVVLFHTDGAIEAQNEAGELYGFDRLEAVWGRGRSPETDAEGWIEGILEEMYRFSGTAPQHDDMTFVVLKVGT